MSSPALAAFTLSLAVGTAATAPAQPIDWQPHTWPVGQRINTVDTIPRPGHPDQRLILAAAESRVWLIDPLADPATTPPRLLLDTQGGRIMSATTLDANADGHPDLALGRFDNPWVSHRQKLASAAPDSPAPTPPPGPDFSLGILLNPGNPDAPWQLVPLDTQINQIHGIAAADLNADGHPDLVANSLSNSGWPDSLLWYPGPFTAATPPDTTRRVIGEGQATGRSHYFLLTDHDQDGTTDLLLTASGSGALTVWTSPPDREHWTSRVLVRLPGLTNLASGDLNARQLNDLILSQGHGTGLHALIAPDYQEKITIDSEVPDLHALAAADFTGNGISDIAAVSFTQKTVHWWQNLGDGIFRRHDIPLPGPQEAYDLRAADLDGDGRIDLLVAGRATNNVLWLRNTPAP